MAVTGAIHGLRVSGQRPSALAAMCASEWRWPVVACLGLLLLVEIPHLLAAVLAPSGVRFLGQFWSPHDISQYLAAMREGQSGAWLIHDHLSAEPHAPALIYPFYVLVGKAAGALGASPEIAYRVTSTLARLTLLLTAYRATALIPLTGGQRRLALVLVAFGSGLTSLLGMLLAPTGLTLSATGAELNDSEVSTFLTLFAAPHLMLGLALLLGIICTLAAAWEGRRGALWLLPLLIVALGLVNPFSLATVVAVMGAFSLVQAIRRALTWSGIVAVVLVGATAGPFLLYSLLVFTADPFWGATYGRQNQTLTRPPLDMLIGYGLLLPLAALQVRPLLRRPTVGSVLVLTWVGVSLALMYVPVGYQRRFAFGLHPLLAILAAPGVLALWRRVRTPRVGVSALMRPLLTVLLAEALFGSAFFLWVFTFTASLAPKAIPLSEIDAATDRTPFMPEGLRAAGLWLGERMGPDEVVFGHTVTGNLLAGLIPGRVYVGHWVATLEFTEKAREAQRFFAEPFDAAHARFLADRGITYVVYGPYERALARGQEPPASPPGLRRVYEDGGVVIFQVDG